MKITRDQLLKRGKLWRNDPVVQRGCGVHTPLKYKKKQKQKIKKELKEW